MAEEFAAIELHLGDYRSDINDLAGGQGDSADASGAHVRHEAAEVASIRGADVAVDFAVGGHEQREKRQAEAPSEEAHGGYDKHK